MYFMKSPVVSRISMPVHKRLFLSLLGGGILAIFLLIAGIWYLLFNPAHSVLYRALFLVIVAVAAGLVLIITFGVSGVVLTLLVAKNFPLFHVPIRIAVHTFFPVALTLGRFLHIDVDKIRNSFIEVNNQLVRTRGIKVEPQEILLLAPHCLQWTDCPNKITVDVNNCHRCGGCSIDELLLLRDKHNINMGVATGGTLARKYVEEYRPRAIAAIACERDLTSGIQDAPLIPVLGVTNERPNGPCRDTCISIQQVEKAVMFFLQ